MKKDYKNNIKVSNHFSLWEFESPDTKEVVLDVRLLNKLEDLRELIEEPIIISSGYRTPEYNAKINGHPNSYHMRGMAADIYSPVVNFVRLGYKAKEVFFPCVIIYTRKKFVHVDIGNKTKFLVCVDNTYKKIESKTPEEFNEKNI